MKTASLAMVLPLLIASSIKAQSFKPIPQETVEAFQVLGADVNLVPLISLTDWSMDFGKRKLTDFLVSGWVQSGDRRSCQPLPSRFDFRLTGQNLTVLISIS